MLELYSPYLLDWGEHFIRVNHTFLLKSRESRVNLVNVIFWIRNKRRRPLIVRRIVFNTTRKFHERWIVLNIAIECNIMANNHASWTQCCSLYVFTDFVNVTKFIESMSKHDGNVTHANVTALESCKNCQQVSESDGKISALINCHHSLFVLRHTFPNRERKSSNDDCNDNYDDDHVHVITIVTSFVSGASIAMSLHVF